MDVKVEVFSGEDEGDWPGEDVAGFFEWFNKKIAAVPDEYRDSVVIELDGVSSYEGESEATIEIHYTRPQTDSEIFADNQRLSIRREKKKTEDLQNLARLKRMYETDITYNPTQSITEE